jgi:5-formyltetrahydrofolate cyclo-ligase
VNSADLKRAKRGVRRDVLARRDALDPLERQNMSQAIAARVLALPQVLGAATVLAFWSFGSEVATTPLMEGLRERGVTVALPRIVEGALEARAWVPGDPMSETRFGALEPVEGRVLSPEEIDVIATPGVAFDRVGTRIGYGGGFYDRFFLGTRPEALRAGIGFGLQLVDQPLPAGHFDLRVHVVGTEREVVRCPDAS